MNKIVKYIRNPEKIIKRLINLKLFYIFSDKCYLKILYRVYFKKKLNLDNPKTYNEKIQWLKLNDRKKIYTTMVDKDKAKEYVASIIGEEYIIPNIGVYERFSDIDFDKIPNKFVIKTTHDSGGVFICRDKSKVDYKKMKKIITKSLKRNFYKFRREWPYKNVKPKIIIEKYMEDEKRASIRDYKFFCFNGKPKLMYVSEGMENHSTAKMCFLDMDYNLTKVKRKDYRLFEKIPEKPINFEKMKELAAILSKDIPHLRVDFYEIDGKIYFGELTFATCAGFVPFEKDEYDVLLGSWINIK